MPTYQHIQLSLQWEDSALPANKQTKEVHQKLFNNTQQNNTSQRNLTDHEKTFCMSWPGFLLRSDTTVEKLFLKKLPQYYINFFGLAVSSLLKNVDKH